MDKKRDQGTQVIQYMISLTMTRDEFVSPSISNHSYRLKLSKMDSQGNMRLIDVFLSWRKRTII